MNIATQIFQHPRDEWNGVLNVPCDFKVRNATGATVATKSSL
jgi:hypothetical protein